MLYSVVKAIEKYNMLSFGDNVVVAVSGGPDSIALLHILNSLRDRYNLSLYGAHLNHMLRGGESDGDAAYVEDFCRKFEIPLTVRRVDIDRMSKEEGISHEEAGRKARYSLFEDVAISYDASKIALAHNMNDQAETVLMRIMRGTGLEGLGGIKPVRDNRFIRPLLFTTRSDIENYCKIHSLNPRTDSTNLKPIYSRNKIRLELIPYIRENYCPGIETALSSMAELLKDDNDYLEEHVSSIYKDSAVEKEGFVLIDTKVINSLHVAVSRRLIRRGILHVKGNLTGIESKHIELIFLISRNGTTGAAVELPGSIKVKISYGYLNIINSKGETNDKFCYRLNIPGKTPVYETGGTVNAEIMDAGTGNLFIDNRFIKYFDYDKIKGILSVKSREEGDYIIPIGMRGKKKIKELFIDSKIPREQRDRIPLISFDKEVLWAIGYKTNENYKVTKDTKKVLKLQYEEPGGDINVK